MFFAVTLHKFMQPFETSASVVHIVYSLSTAILEPDCMFEKVACPIVLKVGVFFTTENFDNFDHNSKSTSALTAFHGTAVPLTHHLCN